MTQRKAKKVKMRIICCELLKKILITMKTYHRKIASYKKTFEKKNLNGTNAQLRAVKIKINIMQRAIFVGIRKWGQIQVTFTTCFFWG